MTQKSFNSERGAILPIVIILALALTITGLAFLNAGVMENSLVRREISKNQAFYLAEAGIERLSVKLYAGEHYIIRSLSPIADGQDGPYKPAVGKHNEPITLGEGRYWVEYYDGDPLAVPPKLPYAISIGQTMKGAEVTAEKKIKVKLPFLAEPYEHAIYAASSYSSDWTLELRGTDPRYRSGGRYEYGGKDTVEGDIYVNADAHLYEQATVSKVPYKPVDWFPTDSDKYTGIVNSTNPSPSVILHSSDVSVGGIEEGVPEILIPDLRGMNYAEKAAAEYLRYEEAGKPEDWPWTYCDVKKIFGGISSGNLPPAHNLYDVVKKNDSERSEEYGSTTGDDYFFRPAYIGEVGDSWTAPTPLDLGENRIYYVDGDVWFHSSPTYGFTVSGKATIVATGDIHISDNIKYEDPSASEEGDLLALVALGKYDDAYDPPKLISGGDIYLGDPRFGTTYTVDAFMFAGNNFLYNVSSTDSDEYKRPDTGFNIFGNWVAINEVSVIRDWYETGEWEYQRVWVGWPEWYEWQWVWVGNDDWKPAHFDPTDEEWKDWENRLNPDNPPLEEESTSLRHYQMKVSYDARILDSETQPPGLPQGYGTGSIFAGFTNWQEIQ